MVMKTPRSVYGAQTPAEYREKQRKSLAKQRKTPRPSTEKPTVLVESNGLRIKCECGEYPLVDEEWRMACCFNCGLVYDDLTIPEVGA